ncbi:MAG: glycosyltransferase [bacterium]|nr:glycosyltransferase [bacterium]
MSVPKVSVIIPSYNHRDYIGKAIKSVLMQDYNDFEVIIADDCSADDSVEVIKQYTDERIKTFFLSENIGATQILKFLINNSAGEYIALINSDDEWCEGKLSKQVEFLENNSDYAACFTWASFIDGEGNPIVDDDILNLDVFCEHNRSRFEWLNRFYYYGNCICHPSMLIRKSVYEEIGYYNDAYRQLPDFEYWVRLCSKYSIHILPEVLVKHRRLYGANENTSISSTQNSLRLYSETVNIYKNMFAQLDDSDIINIFKNNFINKDASTAEEIICEKYFLLANNPAIGSLLKNQAIQFFMDNYKDENVARCFREKYNYTVKDFFTDNVISIEGFEHVFKKNDFSFCSTVFYYYQGFAAENSTVVRPSIDQGGTFKLNFTVLKDCKMLRIDPIENYMMVVKSAKAFVDKRETEIQPVNCEQFDSKQYFLNTDPQYIMTGEFKKGSRIEVLLEVDFIADSEFYELNREGLIKEISDTSYPQASLIDLYKFKNMEIERLSHELDISRRETEKVIADFKNSVSWRITKPIRTVKNILSKKAGRE